MLEKRYNHLEVEKGKYQKWKEAGYFASGDISKKPFSIVIPPPNVTGKLHIGHTWDTPNELDEPFIIPGLGNIDDVSSLFQNEYHDPSLSQNAINILSSYMVYIYPNKVNYSKEELLVVFGYIAKELLQGNELFF